MSMTQTSPREKYSPPSGSSSGGQLFGSLPKPGGFLRRNKPSSNNTAKGKGKGTEEIYIAEESTGGVTSTPGIEPQNTPVTGLFSQETLSDSEPNTLLNGVTLGHTLQSHPLSPRTDRRSSVVSDISFTHSFSGPSAAYLAQHRTSLSSFASSTGSPRAPPSSNGTTIGDLSTASMPLLPDMPDARSHLWVGSPSSQRSMSDGYARQPGVASSSASSRRLDSSSDTSSVYSYPPLPMQRPRTAGSSTSQSQSQSGSPKPQGVGVDGEWRPWRKDFRGDFGPGFQSFSRVSRVTHTPPNPFLNPFAPLRKRLVRTLSGKCTVGVELQLVVELIDALDNFIQAYAGVDAEDETATGLCTSPLLVEVFSLVEELCEVAPEVPKCLAGGMYGPLSTSPLTHPVSETFLFACEENTQLFDTGGSKWWPRRLARDCRGLLEEVTFAAGAAPTMSRTPTTLALTETAVSLGAVVASDDGASLTLTVGSACTEEEETEVWNMARQAELLNEGKRRWAEYRQREGEFDFPGVSGVA